VGIVAWNDTAYWRNNDSLRSCPRGGCGQNPATVAVLPAGSGGGLNQIAAAGHGIYWPSPQGNNALCRCLTPPCAACPNPIQVGMGAAMTLAADEAAVYFLDGQRLYRWTP